MSGSDVRFAHRPFVDLTPGELHDVLRLRGDVFVAEQQFWQENDLDGADVHAVHVWGRDGDGVVVATARVRFDPPPAIVSRVAVRVDRRGRGVGEALLRYVHDVLDGRPAVLSAQAHLEGWYRRLGWAREGRVYDDAGLPHVRMVRPGT